MIKKVLKKFPGVKFILNIKNKLFKYLNFCREYKYDYNFFIKNYSNSKETKNKIGYNILLATHSLEKGMSNTKLRYFGVNKTKEIINMLSKYEKYDNYKEDFPFINGINILRKYKEIYEENNWINREEYKKVNEFLNNYNDIVSINVGSFTLEKKSFIKDATNIDYNKFLSSRHSVRNYCTKKIDDNDIKKAVDMAIKSPTACNRQMVKIYYVENSEKREKIIHLGQGFSGFDLDSVNIFLITFDVNANYFIGERNQGWFNSGLVAMNFVNALHSLGIGSCFIQFGNTTKEEENIKNILNIPNNERIAVILSAGYYENSSKIPFSPRKNISDIYKKIS